MIQDVQALESLPTEPKILMMEAGSHHQQANNIGSVKILYSFRQVLRPKAAFFFERSLAPRNELAQLHLLIHCVGCMATRRKLLQRFQLIQEAGLPLVNYGLLLG